MKKWGLACLALLATNTLVAQVNQIATVKPTAQAEAQYVWRTVCDMNFFDKNGYNVALPQHPYLDKIVAMVRQQQLPNSAYDSLQVVMEHSIFDSQKYQKGIEQVIAAIPIIEKALERMKEYAPLWNFKIFAQYQLNLTLYGPGGSYDCNNGSILLQTTAEGKFKMYSNPAYTIIHEMVHIGIEQPIVQKYQLPHAIKEQIVDLFVEKHFKDLLPEYRKQPMGNQKVEELLQTKDDFKNLPKKVEQLVVQLQNK